MSSNPGLEEPKDNEYTVGWICALQEEYEVACKMLDKRFEGPLMAHPNDDNTYEFGRISKHNVVIGCLPFGDYGTNSAANVAKDMVRSFPQLRFALLVGIGAGLPTEKNKICLGDVVVGASKGIHGGIIQLDAVKRHKSTDGSLSTELYRHLNNPPNVLLGALPKVQARYNDPDEEDKIARNLERMANRPEFMRPPEDRLYLVDYPHQGGSNCDKCDVENLVKRDARDITHRAVKVHYGTIGSSNSLMKNVDEREKYANDPDLGILCFEMEAAGLANTVPCLVIRGICDYADSHKNDDWHNYAALTAAAYARELLYVLRADRVAVNPSWERVLDEVQTLKTDFHQDRKNRETDKILSWIVKDSVKEWHDDTYADYYSKRHPGTGDWFETHPKFLAWIDGKDRTLFCQGPPGAGKSVISSIAVKHLESKQDDQDIKCAYLYCEFDRIDDIDQTTKPLLSVLLRQLCEITGLPDLIENHRRNKSLSLEEISTALLGIVKSRHRVFLIIDALDECAPDIREELLDAVMKLQVGTTVRFMATSRGGFHSIEKRFETCSTIEIKAAEEDVQAFVRNGLKHIGHLDKHPLLRDSIPKRVAQAAGPLFLSVFVHVGNLKGTDTEGDIREVLEGLPKIPVKLEETFENSLKRIDRLNSTQRKRTYRLLSWVFHSREPLDLESLEHALSLEERDNQLNTENLPDARQIICRCQGLVAVDQRLGIVKFIHATIPQFFSDNPVIFETIDMTSSYIALACARYLSFDEFEDGPCEIDEKLYNRLKTMPLYTYAACNWGHHARMAGHPTETDKTIREFLKNEMKVSAAVQAMIGYGMRRNNVLPLTGLHLASWFGLEGLAEFLLDQRVNAEASTCDGLAPLYLAIDQGHENIVRLFSKKRVDMNFRNPLPKEIQNTLYTGFWAYNIRRESYVFPGRQLHGQAQLTDCRGLSYLHYAIIKKQNEIANILIKQGVDINALDTIEMTPLHIAILTMQKDAVNLLLSHRADINAKDKKGRTPLITAIMNLDLRYGLNEEKLCERMDKIVKLLIDGRADLDAEDIESRTALYYAIQGNHEFQVKRLLDAGAKTEMDLDMMLHGVILKHRPHRVIKAFLEHFASTPARLRWYAELEVYVAAVEGRTEELKSLLNSNKSIDISSEIVESALFHSAQRGLDAVAEVLLDAGVDIESTNRESQTALHFAAEAGHESAVRTLVLSGANLNAICSDGDTALIHAARGGHDTIIEILLESAARADFQPRAQFDDLQIGRALIEASSMGRIQSINILLQYGAQVDVTDVACQMTAFSTAIVHYQLESMRALIRAGANIEKRSSQQNLTPLQLAVLEGHCGIMEFLLENGADTGVRDENGQTLMHYAVQAGFPTVKTMLLNGEVDINVQDNEGITPLHRAVVSLDKGQRFGDVVKMLLTQGANPGIRDHLGRTPEHIALEMGHTEVIPLLTAPAQSLTTSRQELLKFGDGLTGHDLFLLRQVMRHIPALRKAFGIE
ncbi:ankyrin repeat-containing domain protein [Annulohypoxylon maeteangense]|uniref:ankyrin repeat-containing domain protein n=1 Tax=Annulohypoxylon maeteangense TaxID=1927788 RepID=UPI00200774AF|nr:ankyrin repeat-containing domain protein [Annulohypoxylon maeteangense]KAI0884774.1 ankyrin repeat-containing domain protein [Annulohypoxylon maeteangense]